MSVTLTPTNEQRAILERLHVPDHIRVTLRRTSFTLDVEDSEAVRDALTQEMAQTGFDAAYEPTAEGRVIEDLIDALFIP